ncbi:MAG: acyltransferase [Proteobacteria bacterium]|nr:acyltransferase [Pseudomonadota bacterium]
MGFLRIILALAIVVAHSGSFFGLKFTGGIVSVELFYMISGFYMTLILNRKYIGKENYMLFLSNRFLRIYPMYWVILGMTLIISTLSYAVFNNWGILNTYATYYDVISTGTLVSLIVTNLVVFGQDVVMFLGLDPVKGTMFFTSNFRNTDPQLWRFLIVPQAWMMGLELLFYLIAPFVVRRKTISILTLIIASMLMRFYVYFYIGYANDPWTYRFFPSELALFLLGTISYKLFCFFEKKEIQRLNYFVVIVFFVLVFFWQYIPPSTGSYAHIKNWLFYFFACIALPLLFQITKSWKIDKHIGELSYPIYIVHMLVISCISLVIDRFGYQSYIGEFSVAMSIIIAFILVKLISDPIEKIRQSRVVLQGGSNKI